MIDPVATPSASPWRARLAPWAGGLAGLVLVALIVHNAYWAVRNQRELEAVDERPHVSPRDIAQVAFENPHPQIRNRLGIFYYIGQHLAGANLTIPPLLAPFQWELAEIGHVHVVIEPTPVPLPRSVTRLLREQRDGGYTFLLGGSRRAPRYKDLYFLFDASARDYIVAESVSGDLFVLPMARYLAETGVGAAP